MVVSKIRQDHDVQITMPDKDSERPDVVVITGLEQNAAAARDDILRIVHDFVSYTGSSGASNHGIGPKQGVYDSWKSWKSPGI